MPFLIIDSDKTFSNQLASQFANEFDSEIHIKENASEAIGLIELLDDFNFIIAISSDKEEQLADKIISFLDKKKDELSSDPFILFVGQKLSVSTNRSPLLLPITIQAKEIVHLIRNHKEFQNTLDDLKKDSNKEYSPIPLRLFHYVSEAPYDIFLKMKKDGQPYMLKRFSKGDHFESADIQTLQEKNVKSLYIEKTEKIPFFRFLDTRLASLAQKHPEEFLNSSDLENYAFHSLTQIGISKSSLEVAKQATIEMTKKFEKDKKFQDALRSILKKNKLGLKQLNSKIVSLISYFITKGTDLESSKVISNLIMASYLQDIKLEDEHAGIRSNNELQSFYLNDKQNVLIENHANLAAQEIEKFDNIPSDVIKIVKQHHGSLN
ncbi:MAG: hypothetical protein NXH75_10790, partial [Halobacteriovoraceae bacterium]|nr:hypothetical protein [Halobacteriovoraceae bacterium]